MMMSSMVPVVPKNTSGPRDLRFIPTGIATNAPTTENTHVPSALHPPQNVVCLSNTSMNKTRVDYITNDDSMIPYNSRKQHQNQENTHWNCVHLYLSLSNDY